MKVLIKGAGDLATGVAAELYARGYQIIMTETQIPLSVRRQVAFSRAVYEKTAVVEGITARLAETAAEAEAISGRGEIAVLVDQQAKVRESYRPDVLVDAILAKKNTGTKKEDAPMVIGLGPGFCGGRDCDAVIETMRGETLGQPIYDGEAIPNTGVPGLVGGYAIERLIKAAADGEMKPVRHIGDIVQKGDLLAMTGGAPVYAQIDGIIRGMLQEGVIVKKGLKIGDVDPRKDQALVHLISDKSRKIGQGVCQAVDTLLQRSTGMLLLAAGEASRYGKNKLLETVGDCPMYRHAIEILSDFAHSQRVVVTRFPEIKKAAIDAGLSIAENDEPEKGIAWSLHKGLRQLQKQAGQLKGVLCMVCDQPWLKKETVRRILELAAARPERIVCAGTKEHPGNPVWFGASYIDELLQLQGDTGGRQILRRHPENVIYCPVEEKELQDVDRPLKSEAHDPVHV